MDNDIVSQISSLWINIINSQIVLNFDFKFYRPVKVNKGLSYEKIKELEKQLDFPLPVELKDLYHQFNGQMHINFLACGLFGNMLKFTSLQRAIEYYENNKDTTIVHLYLSKSYHKYFNIFYTKSENITGKKRKLPTNISTSKKHQKVSKDSYIVNETIHHNTIESMDYKGYIPFSIFSEESTLKQSMFILLCFTNSLNEYVYDVCYVSGDIIIPFGIGKKAIDDIIINKWPISKIIQCYLKPTKDKFNIWLCEYLNELILLKEYLLKNRIYYKNIKECMEKIDTIFIKYHFRQYKVNKVKSARK